MSRVWASGLRQWQPCGPGAALGHQQDYGGVTADQPRRTSQQKSCRGSISRARSSACLGKGSCLGWRLSAGGEGKGCWDMKPGGWVGRGVDKASSELGSMWPEGIKGSSPTWWPEGGGLPRKVTWSLGHHSSGRGQSQCQTRSPCSWAVLPFTSLLPIPGHLSSRRCRQRGVCAEAPVSPPGTSPALREPHCCSDRQVPLVSVPSLPPLSLPYSAPSLPLKVLSPLSHLRWPPQALRALEARALSVSLTPIPSTCLEQKDAQAIQTSLISLGERSVTLD